MSNYYQYNYLLLLLVFLLVVVVLNTYFPFNKSSKFIIIIFIIIIFTIVLVIIFFTIISIAKAFIHIPDVASLICLYSILQLFTCADPCFLCFAFLHQGGRVTVGVFAVPVPDSTVAV